MVDNTPDRDGNGPPPPFEWLEQVNRHALVTRMLAATVHDVNNTLQVVSGAAEMLAMDPTPDVVARRTAAIVGHARQATVALQALMAFARQTGPASERTCLRTAADQAVGLRLYALRKAQISVSVLGDAVECSAGAGRVLQILLNVLVNAEDALAGRTGAALTVTVGADAGTASVSVEDNGPGVSAETRAALAHWPPAPPGSAGSLGIGLRVSQWLAARDGGALTHGPVSGGGAVFRLSLPR